MNVLIISRDGELLGIADRLIREGHQVKVVSHNELSKTGRGVYPILSDATDVYSAIKWCKYIVSDVSHSESFYEKVAMFNRPMIGVSHHTGLCNKDCVKEYAVFDHCKVFTPKTRVISTLTEIYKIAMDWKLPSYNIRYDRFNFAGKYTEFMAWAVGNVPVGKTVLLQEPRDGIEVVATGLFNGQEFLQPFFVTTVGNSLNKSCIVAPLVDDKRLTVQNLNRLVPWLRQVDYHGPVNVRLLLFGELVYCLDMWVGFKFPDIYAILEGLEAPLGVILNSLAFGIGTKLQINGKYFGAIEATSEDWKHLEGAPILNLHKLEQLRHIFPVGAMKSDVEQEDMYVSGECETVFTVCSYGSSINENKRRLFRTLENTNFPNITFNTHVQHMSTPSFTALRESKYLHG